MQQELEWPGDLSLEPVDFGLAGGQAVVSVEWGLLSKYGGTRDIQKPGHRFSLILGPESSQTLTPDSTVTDILGLQPGTSYQVAVSALRGREEGPPVVIVARTGQSLTWSPDLFLQRPLDFYGPHCFHLESQPTPSLPLSLPPRSPVSPMAPSVLLSFLLLIPQNLPPPLPPLLSPLLPPPPPLLLDLPLLLGLCFVLCLMS